LLELEPVALPGIGGTAQSADRRQRCKIDIEAQRVDDAFPHLRTEHFADEKLPLRAEGEAYRAATFEGGGRGGKTWGLHQRRRQRRHPQRSGFAFAGWKVGGGQVHGFGDAFIDQVDDEFAAGMDVAGGILGRAVGVVLQAEHDQRGVLREHVEKEKGAALTTPAGLIDVTSAIGRGTTSPHNSL